MRNKLAPRALTAGVIWLASAPVYGQWVSLGAMPAPQLDGNTLTFRDGQAIVSVGVITQQIIRVRFSPTPAFRRDHSYAVVFAGTTDAQATFDIHEDYSTVATPALRVMIRHKPFRIEFTDTAGKSLDQDDPDKGIAYSGRTVRVWKRLLDDEHVFGFGEKTGGLDKRGRKLGGYSYAMWNSDTFAYSSATDPIYVSVPFFLVVREGIAHGIFLDNTFRTSFDIGRSESRLLSLGAEGGELNYYFIAGPTLKDVVAHYTTLTGRIPLPPRWAIGYQQSRYSYYPEAKVRSVAAGLRTRRIPADGIWLDIDYLNGYNPFTWDPARFPDPGRMVGELAQQGFHLVTIVDPHPKKWPGYEPYDSGVAGNHFVRWPDGEVYEANVWPSRAERKRDQGPSVFPDFSRPATREWWGSLYASLMKLGVSGIWNDMNEPAVFETVNEKGYSVDTPSGTMPLEVRHDNEGQPSDHAEIHNVYGMLMSRSTYEGMLRLRPNQRPFVLSRASFAGGQRYAAIWTGDTVSDWSQLQASIPMLAGMGLSGLSFVGVDIGGFAGAPSAELFTRWLQLGVFYPFMRVHSDKHVPEREPWSYGPGYEIVNRKTIELRYELLPEIYNVIHEASETGLPPLRPLVLEFPNDPESVSREDEFLFGSDLLIAPVLQEGAAAEDIYLPPGRWHDFQTGKVYGAPDKGITVHFPVTLTSIPIFVRDGAFVFRQPLVQNTAQMAGKALQVTLYPASRPEAWLYEDDGETLDYQRGGFSRRRFTAEVLSERRTLSVAVSAPQGSYRPSPRGLVLSVWVETPPTRVLNGETPLRRVADLARVKDGWTFDKNGFVIIKVADKFAEMRLVIEGGLHR